MLNKDPLIRGLQVVNDYMVSLLKVLTLKINLQGKGISFNQLYKHIEIVLYSYNSLLIQSFFFPPKEPSSHYLALLTAHNASSWVVLPGVTSPALSCPVLLASCLSCILGLLQLPLHKGSYNHGIIKVGKGCYDHLVQLSPMTTMTTNLCPSVPHLWALPRNIFIISFSVISTNVLI